MGMFGKGKQIEVPDLLNPDVAHELETAARKKFTGSLEVTDVASKQVASLYLFEGGLYAVALPGYVPSIPDRLRVAGTITNDQARLLTVPGSDWPSPLAGPVAVEQNWLTADALASLHQEYLVASLGAVMALAKVKVKSRKGESTKDFCTLPLPVDPLFDTLRMRGGRMAAGWAAISVEGTPSTIALESRQVAPPADMSLPEFSALVAAVDGHSSLDAVAYGLGLTRAEVVHMSMLLVRAGVLRVAAAPALPGRADRLLVPEAFGSVVPQASASIPVVPEPDPIPEPAPEPIPEPEPVVEPEPSRPGSPLLATSAVFAADQAFGMPPVADPEPVEVAPVEFAPVEIAPVEVVPAEVAVSESSESFGDGSAPGWAAALLAAEAVSHAQAVDAIVEPEPVVDVVEPPVAPPLISDVPSAMADEVSEAPDEPTVPLWGAAAAAAVVADAVRSDPEPDAAAVPAEPVQPWAAATPTGALAMPEPDPDPQPLLEAEPAPVAVTPAPARVPDEHVLLLRREMASAEVAELEQLLAKVTEEETEAITRAGSVRARLNSAKEAVARIDADLGR